MPLQEPYFKSETMGNSSSSSFSSSNCPEKSENEDDDDDEDKEPGRIFRQAINPSSK
jgi:hypothetical protein